MMGAESEISRRFCQARLQPRVALFLAEFVLVRLRLLTGPPGTSGSLRQARACGRPTLKIEPPVFCTIGKVLRFLYLCWVRPRLPCCAIVGLISRGALILPVLAPRGRCAVRFWRVRGESGSKRAGAVARGAVRSAVATRCYRLTAC